MSARRPRLALTAVVAFVIGVAVMIPFESTITRVVGIVALAAFVGCGIAAIAEPGFLAADEGEEDDPQAVFRNRRGGS
jgi:hypothetical protein